MELELTGNAALVTASSRGLGKAAATALVREGVNVAINGRTESTLDDAADELRDGCLDQSRDVVGVS